MRAGEQWEVFAEMRKVSADIKWKMKYNLLPESYHDHFDKLEIDWTEMFNWKFMSEVQKCKAADKK